MTESSDDDHADIEEPLLARIAELEAEVAALKADRTNLRNTRDTWGRLAKEDIGELAALLERCREALTAPSLAYDTRLNLIQRLNERLEVK